MRNRLLSLIKRVAVLSGVFFLGASSFLAAQNVKIGFLVKQPEESWFQDEWKFAEQASKDLGFELIKIGVPNAERTIAAIENLAAQKAQGFVICVPDVKLGKAVVERAKALKLKLFTVDDRLIGPDGKVINDVPYMGISAKEIGKSVGKGLVDEMKKRGWNLKEVGAIKVTFDQLPTIKERTDGASEVLAQAGFPAANVLVTPQQKQETESSLTAATNTLNKNRGKFKHWIVFGGNDTAVLGPVRATEAAGIKAEDVIGIGINGGQEVLDEFKKANSTGFFGSILLGAKRHGYETSKLMFDWIKNNKTPPMVTLTSGELITRDNLHQVRKDFGLE